MASGIQNSGGADSVWSPAGRDRYYSNRGEPGVVMCRHSPAMVRPPKTTLEARLPKVRDSDGSGVVHHRLWAFWCLERVN